MSPSIEFAVQIFNYETEAISEVKLGINTLVATSILSVQVKALTILTI